MRKILFIITLFVTISLTSCTDNMKVKRLGGTGQIELPSNQKLITITWKDDNMWYLTRPMRADETPETYKFAEKSSFGMLEGTYIIKETR